jgi:hypothetical protein
LRASLSAPLQQKCFPNHVLFRRFA